MNWYSVFCRVKLTASSAFVFGLLMVVLTSKLGSSATTFLLASRNVDFEQPSGVVIQAGGDPQSFIVRSEAHDMPESLIRSPLDQLAPLVSGYHIFICVVTQQVSQAHVVNLKTI